MSRLMGVDVGEKRFGIALTDPLQMFASPHEVLTCAGDREALDGITRLAAEKEVERIVLGLPLNMDGSRGPAARRAESFAEALRKRVTVPVALWDERLTTKSAHDALIEGDMRRAKRKGVVDKIAAQIMLQHYLDAHEEPPSAPDEEA